MLVVSPQGTLETMRVCCDVPVVWGVSPGAISLASRQIGLVEHQYGFADISADMRTRAERGYGMFPQKNAQICHSSQREDLAYMWQWMAQMQTAKVLKHQGACSLLAQQSESSSVVSIHTKT